MNEAERYLKEKLDPSRSKSKEADVKVRPAVPPSKEDPGTEESYEAVNKQVDSSAGKYMLAVIVCLGIVAGYVMIAALMAWKSGGGYVVKVLVFVAVIGAWKAITGKR